MWEKQIKTKFKIEWKKRKSNEKEKEKEKLWNEINKRSNYKYQRKKKEEK